MNKLTKNVCKDQKELNRKKDFIFCLVMHRTSQLKSEYYIEDKIYEKGSIEYDLIKNGMESQIYQFIPESTLANLLEIIWMNHIYYYFIEKYEKPFSIFDEKSKSRVNELIGIIESTITNNPNAASMLPKFDKFYDYLIFHLQKAHPACKKINENFGYTESFFEVALSESKRFFYTQR